MCILLGAAAATPAPTAAKPGGERARAIDPSWQTYRNERYAFRLSYPADGRIDTHRARGVQHISISRAAPVEADAGAPAGYQVDVLIYDHRLGHKLNSTCRDALRDAHTVRVGKIQALRGVQQASPDDTSAPHAVCVESRRLEIVVRAVEGDSETTLADRILDSVRFGE